MYVMDGLSYERSDGSWQKIEVGVDDGDFDRQCANWGLDPSLMSAVDRHAVLALVAEMLVFARLIIARHHDSDWFPERDALRGQLQGRMAALVKRLRS